MHTAMFYDCNSLVFRSKTETPPSTDNYSPEYHVHVRLILIAIDIRYVSWWQIFWRKPVCNSCNNALCYIWSICFVMRASVLKRSV